MEWRVISAGVDPAGKRSEGTAAYRMLVPGLADILGSCKGDQMKAARNIYKARPKGGPQVA